MLWREIFYSDFFALWLNKRSCGCSNPPPLGIYEGDSKQWAGPNRSWTQKIHPFTHLSDHPLTCQTEIDSQAEVLGSTPVRRPTGPESPLGVRYSGKAEASAKNGSGEAASTEHPQARAGNEVEQQRGRWRRTRIEWRQSVLVDHWKFIFSTDKYIFNFVKNWKLSIKVLIRIFFSNTKWVNDRWTDLRTSNSLRSIYTHLFVYKYHFPDQVLCTHAKYNQ